MSGVTLFDEIGVIAGGVVSVGVIVNWMIKPVRKMAEKISDWIDTIENTEQEVLDFAPILTEMHTEIKSIKAISLDTVKDVSVLKNRLDVLETEVKNDDRH